MHAAEGWFVTEHSGRRKQSARAIAHTQRATGLEETEMYSFQLSLATCDHMHIGIPLQVNPQHAIVREQKETNVHRTNVPTI